MAFSPDGQRIAYGSSDRTVKVWEVATGKELFSLEGHANAVRSVAFSPDGQRIVSGGSDNPYKYGPDQTVKVWEVAIGKENSWSCT